MSFSITKNGILLLSVLAMPAHASYFDPNAYASLGSLNLADTSAPYLFDTGNNGFAPTLRDSGGNLLYTGITDSNTAIFNFSQITISSGVIINAVGTNPLALLSLGDIMLAGRLSADGQGRIGGAGGGDGGLTPFGNGVGPGGGRGKGGLPGFGDGGGFGGHGGDGFGNIGGISYGDLNERLQGGSGGGASANLFGAVAGGGGGGAIELGAALAINFDGGQLSANGGNGQGGTALLAGGGSGGGLILHAPGISFTGDSQIHADGGGAFGGGGRILILTANATLDGQPTQLSVNAAPTGGASAGVIEFGHLTTVPLPASAWLMLSALTGLLGISRRKVS